MAVQLGLKGRLYRNTGTFATPVWNEIGNVRDLTLTLEKGEADVTTRQNDGWRAMIGTLKDGNIEFEAVWDQDDPDFSAIFNAWLLDTAIEFLAMDGDRTATGTTGLRALMSIISVSRSEPLEEAMKAAVVIKPTIFPPPPAGGPPEWVVGPQ